MRHIIFGESHGPAIGVVLEGVPAGLPMDLDFIGEELKRRAPGQNALSTARKEADQVRLLSGVFEGKTTGAPLCAVIENTDTRSKDYEKLRYLPRPSHADYTGQIRYEGNNDYRGGGHFSGRLTAPLVFAGAVAKLYLHTKGITVCSHIREIGGVVDFPPDPATFEVEDFLAVAQKEFPVFSNVQGEKMQAAILNAKSDGDSVGGVVTGAVFGLSPGLGGPDLNDTVEGAIARQMFAVPAVKGIEFGAGFSLARMRGSTANDPFEMRGDGTVGTKTNHSGGVNGGITNGMPLLFSVVLRPTPSIGRKQETVNLKTKENAELTIEGRHDPCIVHRAVPVIEAAAALAVCEIMGV